MTDPFNLGRFVEAQKNSYAAALAELRAGHKKTHWMWYIFPVVAGIGSSAMAVRYAIGTIAEAKAYLAHPVLGPRLQACTDAMLSHAGTSSARAILGGTDAYKLQCSMTLYEITAGNDGELYARVLEAFYRGERNEKTLAFLTQGTGHSVPVD